MAEILTTTLVVSGGTSVNGKVVWSNSDLFDGYLRLVMTLPTGYTKAFLRGTSTEVPQVVKIPIIEGVPRTDMVKPLHRESLQPPDTTYTLSWYDLNGAQIDAGGLFNPTTSGEHTIAPPTLTIPS